MDVKISVKVSYCIRQVPFEKLILMGIQTPPLCFVFILSSPKWEFFFCCYVLIHIIFCYPCFPKSSINHLIDWRSWTELSKFQYVLSFDGICTQEPSTSLFQKWHSSPLDKPSRHNWIFLSVWVFTTFFYVYIN